MTRRPEPTTLARAVQGALAVLALGGACAPAWAQSSATPQEDAAIRLKPGQSLLQQVPSEVRKQLPVFVWGESLEGEVDGVTVMQGGAELRRHDTVMRADRIEHDKRTGETKAQGNVLINRNGDRFTGPDAEVNVNTHWGHFNQPEYSLLKNEGKGDARRVDFMGDDRTLVHDGRYSTCPRPPGSTWMPDWIVRASSIELDRVEDIGIAKSGVIEFKGVPILAAPILSFPLSDQRKTGALPPSLSISTQSGVELTTPYYFNIAPNYDATVTPTLMTKRGLDLSGEFRYLQPAYLGNLRASYMPSDRLRDDDRWAVAFRHNQQLTRPLGGGGPLGLRVNLNKVSDDNYWRDFPRTITSLTSRLLYNEVLLGWNAGPWSASAGMYRYQTLQDVDAPITPPFDRLPSMGFAYEQPNLTLFGAPGWDLSLSTNVTRFERSVLSAGVSTGQKIGGDRAVAVAQIGRRWQAPGWYVMPKAQVHLARYGNDNTTGSTVSASRSVPTVSIDSGLVFERPAEFFGTRYIQTLEPRAFATWTPFRDQSKLPNYDSASRSFNYSSMFAEHAFSGNDRISDTRAVTVGVSSRLLDPATGAEVVRLGVAQRALLADQLVTLPGGSPVTERLSDTLFAARVQWDPLWSVDANVQYNTKTRESRRTTLGGRYTPGPYRVLSAAYRIEKGVSEQLDLGWQWPLSGIWGRAPDPVPGRALGPGQWYGVGRLNYSMPDRKLVDVIAGFEYDAGCWLGRIVMERLQTSSNTSDRRILFQLEFNGFSKVGGSSLQSIQANVPKYRYLREEIVQPNRFEQYD
jgi:LPS-assembly protein